jgi:hypothetical protein
MPNNSTDPHDPNDSNGSNGSNGSNDSNRPQASRPDAMNES